MYFSNFNVHFNNRPAWPKWTILAIITAEQARPAKTQNTKAGLEEEEAVPQHLGILLLISQEHKQMEKMQEDIPGP